jgi:hypothetical protein
LAAVEASVGDISFKGPSSSFSISNSERGRPQWDRRSRPASSTTCQRAGRHHADLAPRTLLAIFSSTAVNPADACNNRWPATLSATRQLQLSQHFLRTSPRALVVSRGSTQIVTPTAADAPRTHWGCSGSG